MSIKHDYHVPGMELLCLGFLIFAFAACSKKDTPVAEVIAKDVTVKGDSRTDNYFWLRERENPEVIEYLKSENTYAERMMADTEKSQGKLYKEMLSRIKETDLDVPVRDGDYFYYKRTEAGKQYPIHCRKKGSLEADEEIILDENELASGTDYFKLGVFEVSPNHQLLAYSADSTGTELYTIHVKDLATGKLLPDQIPNTSYSLEWANDNQTFFYTTVDETLRPDKVYRHVLGGERAKDRLVHFEEDDGFFLYVSKTKSEAYLLLELWSKTTSEIWYMDADSPAGKFKVIHPRQRNLEYEIEHSGDQFFVLCNDSAINFKVMEVNVAKPAKENWVERIPHRENVKIDGIELFRHHLVVYERENGLEQISLIDLGTNQGHYIKFDEAAYSLKRAANPEFDTNVVRFQFSSFVTPPSVFDYNMDSHERQLMKQKEVLGGYDASGYTTERIYALAQDSVKIPISLVYKKGLQKNGENPLLLYGYGSYGVTIDPGFNSNLFSLLDRGFVYAIAHVRGGGALGRQWYENGKLLRKKNTFSDFIACAEHLIAEAYTRPKKLVISGGSAGGLLVGAVLNMRPELFAAAFVKVPFVDILNTMLDASIPLTVLEYEEWGNPNEREVYEYIRSYSPYDNVAEHAYPNLLIRAGLNDSRVQYWEPAKWAAKLRAAKTDDNLLLLKTNMGAGHGGASGRYDNLKEAAFDYAFIFKVLDIKV